MLELCRRVSFDRALGAPFGKTNRRALRLALGITIAPRFGAQSLGLLLGFVDNALRFDARILQRPLRADTQIDEIEHAADDGVGARR